jgi:hypothetical protein
VSKKSPRERIERAFHVSFMLPEQAAELLDAYRAQVFIEAAELLQRENPDRDADFSAGVDWATDVLLAAHTTTTQED